VVFRDLLAEERSIIRFGIRPIISNHLCGRKPFKVSSWQAGEAFDDGKFGPIALVLSTFTSVAVASAHRTL
jgi:hypothetical protein